MNFIQPFLRRIAQVQTKRLRVENYYSTKPHFLPIPSIDLDVRKQHLGRYRVKLLSFLQHRTLQQNAANNTITANNSLAESQMNNIRLARRLVSHIFDQTSIENPETTKEAQDRLTHYRQLISHAKDLDTVLEEINELLEIVNNSNDCELELVNMAEQDLSSCYTEFYKHFNDTLIRLLPDHAFDAKSAVLEVRAGAGGNEASLFAEEIFNLYVGYSEQCFEVEKPVVDSHQGQGIDYAKAIVNGCGAFRFLKYECGVHRVQRVPKASTGNKSDRLQTSTCSVAVLPVPDDTDQIIPTNELEITFMRSGGPGGQNVNKIDSACRIVHIPTGFSVKCQEFKTQNQNKAKALKQIQTMVYQQIYEKEMNERSAFRKSQIGNMNRNEKIRTYNFNRNQIIDHRIDKGTRSVSDITAFFNGKLGYEVINGLKDKIELEHQIKSLEEYLASF